MDFGFHFNQSTLALMQGGNDARREYFKKQGPAKSLVRELGQNSLDAKSQKVEGPVRIVFELKEVSASSIPDFENLSEHIRAANIATTELAGPNTDFVKATEATNQTVIPVLRISDYRTTGLPGHEDDVSSPLAALTRTSGVSAKPQGKGGSFGIGAAAGAYNSRLLTVFWTTMAEDNLGEVVFAGRSDLASHKMNGSNYDATGIYLDRASRNTFKYLRNQQSFLGFEPRREPGTDTYIPAYVGAERDPELSEIRDAFVENFFAAFRAGHLEVEGRSGEQLLWELNEETIRDAANSLETVRPFFEALDSNPIVDDLPGLGEVKLYVNLSPALRKRYHTIQMRSPLMAVCTYEPRMSTNYAAVFVCDSPEGNELLRSLEPPTHDDWVRNDPDFPAGRKSVNALRKFIRESIRELIATAQGDEIRLDGLKELLPSTLGNPDLDEVPLSEIPSDRDEASPDETSTVHGDDKRSALSIHSNSVIKPRVRRPGDSDGAEDALGGSRARKSGRKKTEGGSKHTSGGQGEGAHSIAAASIGIETWFNSNSKCFYVAIHADPGTTGDLTLCAQGEQGPEEKYDLQIVRVSTTGAAPHELEFKGNTIKNISIPSDDEQLLIKVETENHRRLRLGVI